MDLEWIKCLLCKFAYLRYTLFFIKEFMLKIAKRLLLMQVLVGIITDNLMFFTNWISINLNNYNEMPITLAT